MKEKKIKIGDVVYWNDPDNGLSSGYGSVISAGHPEIVTLKMFSGSEAEVLIHEIEK